MKNSPEKTPVKTPKKAPKIPVKTAAVPKRNKKDREYGDKEWVQLHPRGLLYEGNHFVLILEDELRTATLPLRFPVDSADLLGVPNIKSLWKKSLETMLGEVFKAWNIELERCTFVKQTAGRHRVQLFYKKDGREMVLEQDLDRVLGICLEAKIPFYATRDYIHNSQVTDFENENFLENQKWTDGRQKYLM